MERNDHPLSELLSAFTEGEQRLKWAKLIRNKFRQNSEVRKTERELFKLSEQIIDMANCRTILLSILLPPSFRRRLRSENPGSSSEEDSYSRAFYSLLEPYWNADKETREVLDQIPDISSGADLEAILEQVPDEVRRPLIWNAYIRDHWTPSLRRSNRS